MPSPYGMEIVESCLTCKLRAKRSFCDLPPATLQAFEGIKYATAYPRRAALFVQGQLPRGIFVLCKGSAKLAINSPRSPSENCHLKGASATENRIVKTASQSSPREARRNARRRASRGQPSHL